MQIQRRKGYYDYISIHILLGFLIYFGYGVWNSSERTPDHPFVRYDLPPEQETEGTVEDTSESAKLINHN